MTDSNNLIYVLSAVEWLKTYGVQFKQSGAPWSHALLDNKGVIVTLRSFGKRPKDHIRSGEMLAMCTKNGVKCLPLTTKDVIKAGDTILIVNANGAGQMFTLGAQS